MINISATRGRGSHQPHRPALGRGPHRGHRVRRCCSFVLGKFVWPQFEKAYAARTKAIEGGIAKAEEAQNEAKAALDRYNQQLAGAREEAAKIREDARAQAQAIRDDMLAQAHAETERIAAAGRAQLDAQRSQIVAELRLGPRPGVGRAGQQGRR